MTKDEIRAVVLRVLGEIAPEVDVAKLKLDVRIRDQVDLDSMDMLNFIIALHKEINIEIPEVDYPKLLSVNSCTDYLASHQPR
jgi:acyl carrier protein